ncbi:MAG: metallophosphoesterase family protein [Planctomycetes bacterium]|nr:metallophosphoesterase family protein [Planctomycetota bacterium]
MSYPRTALISDLHGNEPALLTAIAHARERGVERYVCLGDVIGYGARPRQALELVMQLCVPGARDPGTGAALLDGLCLLGNHEYALFHSSEDFNPKARAALDWTREELVRAPATKGLPDYFDFLGGLAPMACDEVAMFAHGSPRDPVKEYMLPRDAQNPGKLTANFARMERSVCFVGHSHVPAVYYEDGTLFRPRGSEGPYDLGFAAKKRSIVNVGSVGQPRDGDPRLSYVIFDGRCIEFLRLDYDHAAAAAAIRAEPDLPEFLAERLSAGR